MAEAARGTYGGYSGFKFVDKVSDAQKCPICLSPMRDTVQTAACGHRFCRSCLLQTFRQSNSRFCPQDRTPIPSNDQFFLDLAWQRDVNSLRVKCKRWKKGCDWIGAVGRYEEHFRVCKYKEVTCNDCGSKMQERHLNTHQTTNCPFRTVQCEFCGENIIAHFKEMHEMEQCRNFCDKLERPHKEDGCTKKEKEICKRNQEDFQRKIILMNTKTANAVASLKTAANYLDEAWKIYDQSRSGVWWGKMFAGTGGIAAIAMGHPVIGGFCFITGLTAGMTGDVFTLSLRHFLARKWSPELDIAKEHFMEAESAIQGTIQFWKESPTLAKMLCKIHEDILQKAENVPITPKQAGSNTLSRATAAIWSQDVHYSVQDIVKNWGRGAAKILRQKAEELNELMELRRVTHWDY